MVNHNDFIHPQESAQPVLPPSSSLSGIKTTPPHTIPQPGGWRPGWLWTSKVTPGNIFVTSSLSLNLSLWESLLGTEVRNTKLPPKELNVGLQFLQQPPSASLKWAGTQGTSPGPAVGMKNNGKTEKVPLPLSRPHWGAIKCLLLLLFLICGWF